LIDLDYKPVDDTLLYAKYARGYRAGGIIVNAPADHRTFDPEKVDSFEIGAKTRFAEAVHGLFDVALFYNNFTNQQIQIGYNAALLPSGATAPVSPTTAILNAGKSRIYGAEIETSISPLTGLRFDLTYTYLNATIRSIGSVATTDPNYMPAVALTPGDPLALSPKNKASLEGDYTLPLPANIGRVIFGATFVHTDKQLTNYKYLNPAVTALFGENLSYIPATNLLNLNLAWNSIFGSHVDVSAFVINVTQDENYRFIPGIGSAGAGAEFAVLGEPRMYGARVRYSFGR
jgi:iron complex outermembrane receptor protein